MRHQIPYGNWPTHLTDAINKAEEGDTIVCHSEEMQKLAERARVRKCPLKPLTFELEASEFKLDSGKIREAQADKARLDELTGHGERLR